MQCEETYTLFLCDNNVEVDQIKILKINTVKIGRKTLNQLSLKPWAW